MKRLLLASTSPRRRDLLKQVGMDFEVIGCDYEEDITLDLTPPELVKLLSKGKAESVVDKYPGAVIVSGDTVVAFDGQIFGKPLTPERAMEMLRILNGTTHEIITGYTVIDTDSKKCVSDAVSTQVEFYNLTDDELWAYIKTGEPLERAGGYEVQGIGAFLVKSIKGDFANAVGLPVSPLLRTLRDFDIYPTWE